MKLEIYTHSARIKFKKDNIEELRYMNYILNSQPLLWDTKIESETEIEYISCTQPTYYELQEITEIIPIKIYLSK